MSSISGAYEEGGKNEDVEADESTRNDDGRLGIVPDQENDEQQDGTVDLYQEGPGEANSTIPDTTMEDEHDAGEPLSDEDTLQLSAARDTEFDEADSLPDEGPATPTAQSPLASPAPSGSIPDDTPSPRGSLLSSPGRNASPTPRRAFSRTGSVALQPFERRFETRLSGSPSSPARPASPAFLSPHSRQISLSSQISPASSPGESAIDDVPQAPWDVVKWTKLRKISNQALSESGKRSFGRPTCLAVSALIAIGTSKGLVLGFDYHQTLKIIIGPGTKATECGSVTALSISADYSIVASGHANGYIFTWEISRPSRPFLQIPPLDRSIVQQPTHPDGHLLDCAILHIGFLGTRHTALVSADAGGMAFSQIATRGLGPVTRTVKTTRLLGRYPSTDPSTERSRKPSSVLAFSPLPLGNVEQATDGMGLTALLTPYLLVIVSTTPVAQTQYKSPRPKDLKPHSTLSGCLAWFPAVKLKSFGEDAERGNSYTKLAYCWSNVLSVLDVKVFEGEDLNKPPNLEFQTRSRWRSEEAIVAMQWLGRSVLGLLTISQRLLIIEDGSLQVTDSIDLLHRHLYHQDLFSLQLRSVVERLDTDDPSLHGVVADAYYMSFRTYKGRIFLLGYDDLTLGTLSNWADRLMALMEAGDYIAAIRLATQYYAGGAGNISVGLPENNESRHEMVKERLLAMISASLNYTFSQQDDERDARLRELVEACFEACLTMAESEYLFNSVFDMFEEAEMETTFLAVLEPYVLEGDVKSLPPVVVKSLISHFISDSRTTQLEELLCRLDSRSFDLDQMTTLCRQHNLYDALIYVWTQGIGDFVTPFIDLLSLIKMLHNEAGEDDFDDNPIYDSAMKAYPYLAYSLTGRRYPSGDFMDDYEAARAKVDLYGYLFAGKPTPWPQGSKKVFRTAIDDGQEPAFPYLVLLWNFDPANLMSMLNEAFEDSFLNEADEDMAVNGRPQANGYGHRHTYGMSRQHIFSIMLDVSRHNKFTPEQVIYLHMFIARSLPKYPGQLVLSGSLLTEVLQRLCQPPLEELRDDCQLSVEYLLSIFRPANIAALLRALREARFFRVLKAVYRREKMFTELLETYFTDPEDKIGVFDCEALRSDGGATPKQREAIKRMIIEHVNDLADISVVLTARTLWLYASDLLQPASNALQGSHRRFIFLRTLLEPDRLPSALRISSATALPTEQQVPFVEQYVQLMCTQDPSHVAEYINVLPSSDLRLEKVLPSLESSGVVDAAVILLARDGLVRDAMDRLTAHLESLQRALAGLIQASSDTPDVASTHEAAEDLVQDIEKYTKVGIWLCQGQSLTAQRRPRPRTNFAWDVNEDDLDLDEYLWLNLVDVTVRLAKDTSSEVTSIEDRTGQDNAFERITAAARSNVQQVFTALLAATATPNTKQTPQQSLRQRSSQDSLSFLRVLRAFLTRAASQAPTLSDLRAVLTDIFSAYAYEQGVLSLANELLGSDVFADIQQAHELRQRGWRPRSQACEICKRRAWGQGIGELVWDEWVARERNRDATGARKRAEAAAGADARAVERGKGKAKATSAAGPERDEDRSEEAKKLVLVVFACRHVFHRGCLDEEYREGEARSGGKRYRCPICTEQT